MYLTLAIVFILLLVILLISKNKKKDMETPVIDKNIIITDEFKTILDILENTRENIFITGKAGTGKSTLLKFFSDTTKKKHAIVASTGVAALNIKGRTIHSFFQFPSRILDENDIEVRYSKRVIFLNLEILIIDEVSMVRADLMNAIDLSLRANRNRPNEPFGGVQIVMIGDLYQLPPVITQKEESYIRNKYRCGYFFCAPVFKKEFNYKCFELTHVFRQNDKDFIDMLNRVRIDKTTFEDFENLNSRLVKDIINFKSGIIFLTTTRSVAKNINHKKIDEISDKEHDFQAELTGTLKEKYYKLLQELRLHKINEDDFDRKLETIFPTDIVLKLKKGAQIMMVKNGGSGRWVNGTLATISKLTKEEIWIKIDDIDYKLEKEKWEDIEYQYDKDTDKLEKQVTGLFIQYPIKLAYAITIHKSQGKTFDKIIIDVGKGAFAHGQIYVALSRCKSLDGISLSKEINETHIIVDPLINKYHKHLENLCITKAVSSM